MRIDRKISIRRTVSWIALILMAGVMSAAAQSAPPIVVSSTSTVNTSGTTNVGKVVPDACGDLYELESSGSLMEIPAGGGAAQKISLPPEGLAGTGSFALAISGGNLYVGGMDAYYSGGHLWKIPLSNSCVPQTAAETDIYKDISSLGAISYYGAPNGVVVDASGNAFLSTNSSCCTTTPNWIVEVTSSGTAEEVVSNFATTITSLAVDASDDVFFTTKGSGDVYEVTNGTYSTATAGTPTPVISTGLKNALGLAFDSAGNLYVGDTGTGSVYEVPSVTSAGSKTATLQYSSMYLLAAGTPLGSPLTASASGATFYFGNYDPKVYEVSLGSGSLGSIAVGKSTTATVGLAFNASVTPSSFSLFPGSGQFSMTGGSTPCVAGTAYTAGQSCSESIQYTPAHPGSAVAGATIGGSGGSTLATFYISGNGMGSGITMDPGMVSAVGKGFVSPEEVAIDGAGDTFYADPGNNAVLEFTPGSTTAIDIGTGLNQPSGVAVDGAGNVLISDTGNNRIVEVPMVSGALSNSSQITLVTAADSLAGMALSGPTGIALDSTGNLYIADTGNNRIVGVPYNGSWNLSAASTVASSLNSPLAVATDASGDLYVADSGAGQIYKILTPLTNPSMELAAVGFGKPSGLAVDASGSLFVADPGNGELERIPNISGNLDPNAGVIAGVGINTPYGVAVDPAGNLFVSDSTAGKAYEVMRTSTTLSFGNWAVNSTSGVLSASIENEGNLPLNFSTPYYTTSGSTGDFNLTATSSGACSSGGQVAPGDSCALDASFTPTTSGQLSETVSLASDAANASSASLTLSGNGGTATTTTTALSVTSPASGSPFFGEPITLSAGVTASSGTPAGTVTLVVDGVQQGVATLSSSGTATFSLASGLTGGAHTALAVYNGSSTFSGSVSSLLNLTVTKAPTVTSLTVNAPYNNPLSALSGNSVELTAAIQSSGVGIPTGIVTFTSNGKSIGTAAVLPGSGGTFAATLTTTALPVGSDAIVATYSGDANYIQSASASSTVTVAGSPEITISPVGTSITSSSSGSGTIEFNTTSYGGWTGLVSFSCVDSTLPANARCVFSPGQTQITPSTPSAPFNNLPVKMSIAVNQAPLTPTAGGFLWWLVAPLGIMLFYVRRRYAGRLMATLTVLTVIVMGGLAVTGLSACGSAARFLTPAGTNTVTVVAYEQPWDPASLTSGQQPKTLACPAKDPTQAPCAEQTFKVAVTVK
jgi:sugar lactone lactonase YvrE